MVRTGKKVGMIFQQRTLIFKFHNVKTPKSGFTLIEILVVIALIALVTTVAIPNINQAYKVKITNSTRELASTIRSAYDEAVLKGQVHRMAFDIAKNQYWVEIGERNFQLLTVEQKELVEKKESKLSKEEKDKKKSPFQLAKNINKHKNSLPSGVHFSEIQTVLYKEPIKVGVVYAHVFPHGFFEKLILHLKDDQDRESTLMVNPVTGKSQIFNHYVREQN